MKTKMAYLIMSLLLIHCGNFESPNSANNAEQQGDVDPAEAATAEKQPTGDNYRYGAFTARSNGTLTTAISELPIPICLFFFTEEEKNKIKEGVDMANSAIGFDVFEVTEKWTKKERIIYKVKDIDFDGDEPSPISPDTIGYTYTYFSHLDGNTYNDVIVFDWAMEIKRGALSPELIAHELGHAMGIQEHKLINYKNDSLIDLQTSDIMNTVIPLSPTYSEYDFMMQKQGEILQDYLER